MTFDEQLQRAFEAMADCLRDDVARRADAVLGELSASAEADRNEAVRRARQIAEFQADERLRTEVVAAESDALARGREEGRTEGVAEGRQEGYEEGRAEGIAAGWAEGSEARKREGMEEGWQAGREDALRAGLQVRFSQGQGQAEPSSVKASTADVAAAQAEFIGALLAASRRLVDAVRALGRAETLSEVLETLVTRTAQETSRAAILLPSASRFSGWRFVGFGPFFDGTDGTVFADDESAGVVHEARRTGTTVSAPGAGFEAPVFANLPAGRKSAALPLSMGGEVVAVLYADRGTSESANTAWLNRLEILARYAEQRLETLTAFRAACLVAERDEPANVPADRPVEGRSDEAAAERYARLLVSEIKLYHEADVIAGRRDRDLTTRLGGEIARARALYEQRVPVHVRQAIDIFHAELVRTLANGDRSLLALATET